MSDMEERVRFCIECNSVVGWFALFCETCGARQEKTDVPPGAVPARGTARQAGGGRGPIGNVEAAAEVASPSEARTLVRELFQKQLRLIHKFREQGDELEADLQRIRSDTEGLDRRRGAARFRTDVDRLSERAFEAEHRWEELQRTYNRESEAIEEEIRENLEAVEIDAYLSAAEQEKVEAEYGVLTSAFDALDASLREAGRALALARKQSRSRYLGLPASSPAVPATLAVVSLVLLGTGGWLCAGRGHPPEGLSGAVVAMGPPTIAILLWAGLALARR